MLHLRNTRVFPSSSTIKLYSFPLNKGKLMNRIRSFHQRVSGYGNLVQDVRASKRFLSPKRTISTSPLTQFAVKQQTTLNSSDKYLHFNENDGYYKSSPFPNVQQLNIPLHEYVWRDLDKWQNYVATVDVITGRQYSYAQLRDCTASFALRLQRTFKLQKGDVLAICLPNVPEYPGAILGAIEAGLTVTTVNPVYTAEEIARQLEFSDTKFIIGTSAGHSILLEACRLAKKQIPIACLRLHPMEKLPEGCIDFLELFKPLEQSNDYGELKKYNDIDPDSMVLLPFSSGTTGMPKGVILSHNNITTNCQQFQYVAPCDCTERLEVIPCLLPFFHIYGCTVVMLSRLGLGCKLVTIPQFKPDDLIKSLIEYRGTVLNLVPPIALFMINHPGLNAENIPDLHLIISGAAPIGGSDVDRLLDKFPKVKFCQGYGMTETSPVVLFTPLTNKRYASTGFLTSNTEAKIVALDGEENLYGLGPNQTGELCVRGPQVMKGYLNNPQATDDTFYPGNWLRTGDVAHYDDDGYFYITDRVKELIKVKGFQVPPAELEAILRHHPDILDAAVFGISHEINGEVPRALVVLRPNCESGRRAEEDIYQYVAERVAHYKKLDGGIIFVKEIPKNPTGKILRRVLKREYSS